MLLKIFELSIKLVAKLINLILPFVPILSNLVEVYFVPEFFLPFGDVRL